MRLLLVREDREGESSLPGITDGERPLTVIRPLGDLQAPIETEDVGAVLLDVEGPRAVRTAQRFHELDPDLSVIILVEEDTHPEQQQAMRFSKLAADAVSWVSKTDSELAAKIERALERTARRRRHRSVVEATERARGATEGFTAQPRHVLDRLLESIPVGVVALDRGGVITGCNRFAEQLLVDDEAPVIGKPFDELIEPREQQRLADFLAAAEPGAVDVFHAPSGRHLQLGIVPADETEPLLVLVQDLSEFVRLQHRAIELRERAARQARLDADRLEAANRELARANRRLEEEMIERQRLTESLIGLERMRAVAELAAGVSHNLNNILMGILWPAEQIRDELAAAGESSEKIDLVLRASRRAVALVDRLRRSVTESAEDVGEPVVVEGVLEEAIEEARRDLSSDIRLEHHLEDVPPVRATRGGLLDVIRNLIRNATEAMPDGGRLEISVARASPGAVVLRVRDTGPGMSPATLRRAFEPFFTTKADVGSGLGLSTARRTAELWGGRLTATSAPGEGSTFELHLPSWESSDQGDAGIA